jgi:acetolactate synthase-1/2/3 large subunit
MMNPCYELIAKGYSIPYQAVTKREDLPAAVEKMIATKGPFILECAIKEDDDVLPMTPPGMNVNDMMLEV